MSEDVKPIVPTETELHLIEIIRTTGAFAGASDEEIVVALRAVVAQLEQFRQRQSGMQVA